MIWLMGCIFAALCVGSALLGTWWAGVAAAVLAIAGTAFLALRFDGERKAAAEAVAKAAQGAKSEPIGGSLAALEAPLKDLRATLSRMEDDAELFRSAFASLPAPALVCGDDGTVRGASGGYLAQENIRLDAVVGKPCSQASGTTGASAYPLAKGRLLCPADSCRDDEALAVLSQKEEEFAKAADAVNRLAQRLASASELMSASADEQASGARRQKERTDEAAVNVERLGEIVMDVATNASGAADVAEETRTAAREGSDLMDEAVEGSKSVAASTEQLGQVLSSLDERADEIGQVIGVINDIADQTNLLALNAAIEAARAGDAGRGFAVVADEVRKLAEKTMHATKEVAESIRSIQSASSDAVTSMDRTKKEVNRSQELAVSTGEALTRIRDRAEDIARRVGDIATATEEQAATSESMTRLIEEIADIARDSDEGASQQAHATRELASLSQELLRLAGEVGGKAADTSRLEKSDGMMKGVLPMIMQEYVHSTFGDDTYEAMQDEIGGTTFLATSSYPDGVLHQMAEEVARLTKTSARRVLYGLGLHTPGAFKRMYPKYFRTDDFKTFLLEMDNLHRELTRAMPGIKPPRFSYEDKGKVLFMNYHSARGLFDYFEGILNGSAKLFGSRATIKIIPMDEETARAEIHFH